MMQVMVTMLCLLQHSWLVHSQALIPERWIFNANGMTSSFGSSPTGHCPTQDLRFSSRYNTYSCYGPTSTVLFDGVVPTLTGLDGNNWASRLFHHERGQLDFDFSARTQSGGGGRTLEIVLLNCPEMGARVDSIQILSTFSQNSDVFNLTTTSCDSFIRLCMPCTVCNMSAYFLRMFFGQAYLAELTFYDDRSCPVGQKSQDGANCTESDTTFTIDTSSTTTDLDMLTSQASDMHPTTTLDTLTSHTTGTSPTTTTLDTVKQCSTLLILTSVVSLAVATALTTIISVSVYFAIHKWQTRRSTRGLKHVHVHANAAYANGTDTGAQYEDMDGGTTTQDMHLYDTCK